MKLENIKVDKYIELLHDDQKEKERKRLRNRRKRGLIDTPTKTIRRKQKK